MATLIDDLKYTRSDYGPLQLAANRIKYLEEEVKGLQKDAARWQWLDDATFKIKVKVIEGGGGLKSVKWVYDKSKIDFSAFVRFVDKQMKKEA